MMCLPVMLLGLACAAPERSSLPMVPSRRYAGSVTLPYRSVPANTTPAKPAQGPSLPNGAFPGFPSGLPGIVPGTATSIKLPPVVRDCPGCDGIPFATVSISAIWSQALAASDAKPTSGDGLTTYYPGQRISVDGHELSGIVTRHPQTMRSVFLTCGGVIYDLQDYPASKGGAVCDKVPVAAHPDEIQRRSSVRVQNLPNASATVGETYSIISNRLWSLSPKPKCSISYGRFALNKTTGGILLSGTVDTPPAGKVMNVYYDLYDPNHKYIGSVMTSPASNLTGAEWQHLAQIPLDRVSAATYVTPRVECPASR